MKILKFVSEDSTDSKSSLADRDLSVLVAGVEMQKFECTGTGIIAYKIPH